MPAEVSTITKRAAERSRCIILLPGLMVAGDSTLRPLSLVSRTWFV